ncbi:DUF6327 family protein [Flavobacterium sp. NKUCC04_CG]|uniref:DUF6327 family protein n=1 Tax=Flavobacterium sp. NKUCC04_CG TaxID=2842121 RepID=UPI001C5B1799|nr:DUF6327 family protein [Flavobacterium sp. NKUCC04_CG]MBW3518856.1 hypothetical protein [Flavobacterium sp. NKUCC04_CG]
MMKRQFNSIEEINRELEILDVQRELEFHRMVQSIDDLKEGFTPFKILKNTFGTVSSLLKNSTGVQTFLVTTLLKFIFKKRA